MDKINTIIETDLGKVGITPQLPGLERYDELDLIVQDGRAYLSLKAGNQAEVTDSTWWLKITENAYDMAVRLGLFEGTEEEWVSTLSAASLEAARLCYEQTEKCKEATEEAVRVTESAGQAAERANTLSDNRDKVIDGVWWRYNESTREYENTGILAKGSDFVILGFYGSLEELMDEVPEPKQGDVYGVGVVAPYQVFIYDERREEWVDNGTLKGEQGEKGEQGVPGMKGEIGATGPQGVKGEKGETGATGPQGVKGEKGETGATGPQGVKGEKGETGATGPQGVKGEKGETGAIGPQGVKGETGKDFECPTLTSIPGENTLTYVSDGITRNFTIGQQVRVYDTAKNDYVFYQLYNIASNKTVWKITGSGNDNPNSTKLVFIPSTSDPKAFLGDINDGEIKEILSKFRRCLAKQTAEGEVTIAYLNDDNSNFYEDGTPAILTGEEGDVMVYIPEFYYKYERTTHLYHMYHFSQTKLDNDYIKVNNSLLSAYKAYAKSNNTTNQTALCSVSGRQNIRYAEYNNLIQFATNRGKGYEMMDYEHHCVLAMMFFSRYGTFDSQSILGVGTNNVYTLTGTSNAIGVKDTKNETNGYVNFLGFEGVYGGMAEHTKGVSIDISTNKWTITHPDGSTRVLQSTGSGYIKEIGASLGPYFDLAPIAIGGSTSTYFTDYFQTFTGTGTRHFCRNVFTATGTVSNGITAGHAGYTSSVEATTRLAFRGTIKETKDFSYYKSIPITN